MLFTLISPLSPCLKGEPNDIQNVAECVSTNNWEQYSFKQSLRKHVLQLSLNWEFPSPLFPMAYETLKINMKQVRVIAKADLLR